MKRFDKISGGIFSPSRIKIDENFIKSNCKSFFADKIACKKDEVFAVLVIQVAEGFLYFFGTNYTNRPVEECPGTRNAEGIKTYQNCKDICKQDFHAETCAIYLCKMHGYIATGGMMYITGHPYCCPNCENSMQENDIVYGRSLDSEYENFFGGGYMHGLGYSSSCFFIFLSCPSI